MRTRHRRLPVPKFKCRALIVDDVEDKLYFAYLGWEVRLASNGAEGCLPEHLAAVIARQIGVARRPVRISRPKDGGRQRSA